MGISMANGVGDFDVQQLAKRARAGDKRAQLELAEAFELGRGVERDAKRAEQLRKLAAASTGGEIWTYTSLAGGKHAISFDTGPVQDGLGPPKSQSSTHVNSSGGIMTTSRIPDQTTKVDATLAEIAEGFFKCETDEECSRAIDGSGPKGAFWEGLNSTLGKQFPSSIVVKSQDIGGITADDISDALQKIACGITPCVSYREVIVSGYFQNADPNAASMPADAVQKFQAAQSHFTLGEVTKLAERYGFRRSTQIDTERSHLSQGDRVTIFNKNLDGPIFVVLHRRNADPQKNINEPVEKLIVILVSRG
jgi:hypothetical protein